MLKRYGLIAFVSLVALDLLVKSIVIRSGMESFAGGFGMAPLIGERDVTAIFSAYPLAIKNVVLLTLVGFFLSAYLMAALLVPRNLSRLYFGFSVFIAGLAANALDGALNSGVTSVFLIGNADHIRYHFNIADICSLIGFLITAYYFYKAIPILFPSRAHRRSYWVDPEFQTRYSLLMCGFGFSYAIIVGFFSFTFFKALIKSAAAEQGFIEPFWMTAYLFGFSIITLVYMAALLAIVRRVTHSIAGPIYAFEKTMRDAIAGKDTTLRLRTNDEFQRLNGLAADIIAAIQKK